jgi:putative salt-induced outer membrane protein YdiY
MMPRRRTTLREISVKNLVRIAMVACAVLATARAGADEIQFTNGDKLTGKITRLADGKLGFDSKVAGTIAINWADIATLSSDEPVTVVLDGGQVVVDKLVAAEPGSVKTAGNEQITSQTIVLASTAKLNPEPVQWKGQIVAAARFDRGNTVGDAFTTNLDAVRRSEMDRITFGAGYAAEESQDSDQTGKHATKDKMFGTLQYDYFFEPKWYGYVNARGDKDRIADLTLRFTAGSGVGYQWIETDTLKFNTEAGLSWISENYSNGTSNNDYLAARVAWNFDWILYTGLSFFQYTRLYPSLESSRDQLVDTSTGLRYKLFGNFFGESKVLWVWDSTPAEGKKRNDVSYLLGFGYGF